MSCAWEDVHCPALALPIEALFLGHTRPEAKISLRLPAFLTYQSMCSVQRFSNEFHSAGKCLGVMKWGVLSMVISTDHNGQCMSVLIFQDDGPPDARDRFGGVNV